MLARPSIQEKLEPFLGRFYRLAYNLFAALKIVAVLYLGRIWVSDVPFSLFENTAIKTAGLGMQLLGFIVLLLALLTYDIGRFSGVTQVLTGERVSASSNEPLQRRFLNRWMRHPLYTGAFLILWGAVDSPFSLSTAALGTLYLLVGTSFEERKLRGIYGQEYRRYQKEVPKYFPSFKQKCDDKMPVESG